MRGSLLCRLLLLAGWLLAGLVPAARSALFFTDFPPGNWTKTYDNGNPGSFFFTGNGSATVLTFNASGTAGTYGSDTTIRANSVATGSVSFHWTLAANGDIGSPTAYYYVGTTQYALLGTSGTITGINVSSVGTTISFELVGAVSAGKSPAQLQIMDVVPETGNALAGMLVLAAAGFEWFRRKRTAGG
jgi:hypothetical protein